MQVTEPQILPPPIHLHPPPASKATPNTASKQPETNNNPNKNTPNKSSIPVNFKSPSFVQQYWTDFGRLENKTFVDKFCHEKDITVKIEGKTTNDGSFKIKQTLEFNNKQLTMKDNIRITFPIQSSVNQKVQLKITDKRVGLHFDNGITTINQNKINFYGSIGTEKGQKKYNVKLGASVFKNAIQVNNRLKLDTESLTWYHKILYLNRYNGLRFGFIGALDVTHKQLVKRDFLIGLYHHGLDLSLKLKNQQFEKISNYRKPSQWWNQIIFTTTFRRNLRLKYGVQVVYNPQTRKTVASGVYQNLVDRNTLIKGMLNSKGVLTFVVQNRLSESLTLGLGGQFSLKDGKGEKRFGGELMFNL